jgi:hypothetical protein
VVQSENLSEASADGGEVISSEREIRHVVVSEVIWVYELEIQEICRVPCTLAEVSSLH